MVEIQKIKSHRTWIVSLLAFILFNVAFQYFVYCAFSGISNYVLWNLCVIVLFVAPCVGSYTAGLFLFRNKHLIPPWRQIVIPLGGVLLIVGNLICFSFVVVFLCQNLSRFVNFVFNEIIRILAG
jgi:hypothetical protein